MSNKFWQRMTLGKSGRLPWTRREIDEWLQHINKSFVETEPGEWDFILETVSYLHIKYGRKAVLWTSRAYFIFEFMGKFRSRLISDGHIQKGKDCDLLSDELLNAFAKLPLTNKRTGFSYTSVANYIRKSQNPS
jgi:hypothetical protein